MLDVDETLDDVIVIYDAVSRPTVIVQHLYDMCLVDEVPPSRAGGLVLCPVCYAAGWVESGFDIKQQV